MKTNWLKFRNSIPHKVNILGEVYHILWTEEFLDEKTMGETRHDTKEIVIKKGLSNKLTVETYWHEFCHALDLESDVKLTETQVLKMEKWFPYVFNPGNFFLEQRRKK